MSIGLWSYVVVGILGEISVDSRMAMLQTEMSPSTSARAETRHHGDQRDQNESENDYEFDHGENFLSVVMPRHSEMVRIEDITRNYACFSLHEYECCQIDRKLAMGL